MVHNHMPHNACTLHEAANGLPFTHAVPAQATVHFLDADDRVCAVLMHREDGFDGDGRASTNAGRQPAVNHAADAGYRKGEGSSVLYAASPYPDFEKFFESLPTTSAAAAG